MCPPKFPKLLLFITGPLFWHYAFNVPSSSVWQNFTKYICAPANIKAHLVILLVHSVNSPVSPVPPYIFLPSFSLLSLYMKDACWWNKERRRVTLRTAPAALAVCGHRTTHCLTGHYLVSTAHLHTHTHTSTHTLSRPVTLCSITPHCHHLQGMLTESDWQQKGMGVTEKNTKEVEGTDWNRETSWAQEVDVSLTRQALALWRVLKCLDWTLQNRGNGEGKEAQ